VITLKKMRDKGFFYSDGQLKNEIDKCEYCEEKPCRAACPANCSPADFIMAAKLGNPSDFRRAAAEILSLNPLGGICGMVCPDKHCMSGCVHKEFDFSLDIPNIQSKIIQKAKELGVAPEFKKSKPNGKKVAVIGAGPAGIGCAAYLSQKGFKVEVFEKSDKSGGACNLIPDFRLPKTVLKSDIDFVYSLSNINVKYNSEIKEEGFASFTKKYDAVVVSTGLQVPYKMNILNENLGVYAIDYLSNSKKFNLKNKRVAVLGGGATAADCAFTAEKAGAKRVEIFALEVLGEMPLTVQEMRELIESGIDVNGRIKITGILSADGNKITGLSTAKVELPAGVKFNLRDIKEIPNTNQIRNDIDFVIIAIGNHSGLKKNKIKGLFYSGDCDNGPTTVVEAVAAGKNTGLEVEAFLTSKKTLKIEKKTKSFAVVEGYNAEPVSLETDFFGRKIRSPFLLSAAPTSDGFDQMKKAYEHGWAGGIMKTAFDGIPIHIPSEYMCVYNENTYGNCDNVSGHSLDRVCSEVKKLVKLFPDRLTMASTGGPVTGDDINDKKGWQANTKKLEKAGVMGIEYSLSCPQGGDGTEGDIVSQNAELTAKIIDWVMEISDPNIPKLFKLTGAVTSIYVIGRAVKKVFDKYPKKKAGITLANTFPTLHFQNRKNRVWEDGVVIGMSGEGVTPISNFNLANISSLKLHISGNGGPMDYKAAGNFLALGCKTVQFCTIATKYGYGIYKDLSNGLSEMMKQRGIKSMKELIGIILPEHTVGFMDLSPVKKISTVNEDLCEHCGNCSRCPYMAITLNEKKIPVTDPEKCIGCGICTLKCFANALSLRKRTKEELKALKED